MIVPLALLIPGFALLALLSVGRAPALPSAGTAVLSLLGLIATLAWLLTGAEPTSLPLPFGVPGTPMRLALDPLTAPFLVILFGVALLAGLFGLGYAPHQDDADRTEPFLPAFVGAMLLTLLAADGFTLLAGFEGMSLLSLPLVLGARGADANQRSARLYLGVAGFGAACLVPAIGLLGVGAESFEFERIRLAAPEGWQASALLWLVLFGAGSKAGLVPFHPWLPPAHAAAPSHISALMSGAMTKVAVYVLVRLLFDLAGPVQPWWWGAALMGLGAGSMALGALRAVVETDLKVVLACSTIENLGLIAICLGLALAFRGADASPYAALALGAGLLHAVNHAAFKSLLFLAAGGVLLATGSRSLGRLGGLLRRAPGLGTAALVGCLSAAALPPLNGFASEWLAFQAVLVAPRQGTLGFQIGASVVAGIMALSVAVAAAAFVRLYGVAFLSRPRSLEAAEAQDLDGPVLASLVLGAGLCIVLGLLPRLPLLLVDGAVLSLTGGSVAAQAGWLAVVAPGSQGGGYAPLVLALLLALAYALARAALGFAPAYGIRRTPAWGCGFAPQSASDPLPAPFAQTGPEGFGQPLRRIFGSSLLTARERVVMPEPGSTTPARFTSHHEDPAEAHLLAPLARATAWAGRQVNRVAALTIRQNLVLVFGWLVSLLALLALLAGP